MFDPPPYGAAYSALRYGPRSKAGNLPSAQGVKRQQGTVCLLGAPFSMAQATLGEKRLRGRLMERQATSHSAPAEDRCQTPTAAFISPASSS